MVPEKLNILMNPKLKPKFYYISGKKLNIPMNLNLTPEYPEESLELHISLYLFQWIPNKNLKILKNP